MSAKLVATYHLSRDLSRGEPGVSSVLLHGLRAQDVRRGAEHRCRKAGGAPGRQVGPPVVPHGQIVEKEAL